MFNSIPKTSIEFPKRIAQVKHSAIRVSNAKVAEIVDNLRDSKGLEDVINAKTDVFSIPQN